jgi:hypothetical protein
LLRRIFWSAEENFLECGRKLFGVQRKNKGVFLMFFFVDSEIIPIFAADYETGILINHSCRSAGDGLFLKQQPVDTRDNSL